MNNDHAPIGVVWDDDAVLNAVILGFAKEVKSKMSIHKKTEILNMLTRIECKLHLANGIDFGLQGIALGKEAMNNIDSQRSGMEEGGRAMAVVVLQLLAHHLGVHQSFWSKLKFLFKGVELGDIEVRKKYAEDR